MRKLRQSRSDRVFHQFLNRRLIVFSGKKRRERCGDSQQTRLYRLPHCDPLALDLIRRDQFATRRLRKKGARIHRLAKINVSIAVPMSTSRAPQ